MSLPHSIPNMTRHSTPDNSNPHSGAQVFGGVCRQVDWFSLQSLQHAEHIDGQLTELHLRGGGGGGEDDEELKQQAPYMCERVCLHSVTLSVKLGLSAALWTREKVQ